MNCYAIPVLASLVLASCSIAVPLRGEVVDSPPTAGAAWPVSQDEESGRRRRGRRDHPALVVSASFAPGNMTQSRTTSGGTTTTTPDVDAWLARFHLEGGGKIVGGGVDIEYGTSDDYGDINLAATAEMTSLDLSPFLQVRPIGGRIFRAPIRIGPYLQTHQTEAASGGNEILYLNFGARAGIEPEIDVVHTDGFKLSFFGGVDVGVGIAAIDDDVSGEEWDSEAVAVGVRAGVRMVAGGFLAGLDYVNRTTTYDESDPEGVATFPETEWEFEGVMLTGGFRF